MNSDYFIQKLNLQPHPEGGYFAETYRSELIISVENQEKRNVSTAIYFLLENEAKSKFHRIKSDELWFFLQGEALEIVARIEGEIITYLLGNNLENGEYSQAIIQANCWFAARIKNAKGFSLVSCTVAPGFDFSDFELAGRQFLLDSYPSLIDKIEIFLT
jgi:hypothetical protein